MTYVIVAKLIVNDDADFADVSWELGEVMPESVETYTLEADPKPEQTYTRVETALRDARQEQLASGHDWDVADAMQTLRDLGVVATA